MSTSTEWVIDKTEARCRMESVPTPHFQARSDLPEAAEDMRVEARRLDDHDPWILAALG